MDTRGEILVVARDLFASKGYEQTSLREIADRVGLTKASLYYHYPSKQALLHAIVAPLVAQWREVVENGEKLECTPDNVRLVLTRCLDALLGHRGAAGIFLRDAAAVFGAVQPLWEDLLGLSLRLQSWLAGPAASTADRIRAAAAAEVLGACLTSSAGVPDATEDELRRTLLDAAAAVLQLD